MPRRVTLNSQRSTLNRFRGFTLVEILVVVVLLSFIILALMTVFNATQTAFRASITQTDVMEGGRGVLGLMKNDFESMTPSMGQSNVNVTFNPDQYGFIPSNAPVNFSVITNNWQYQSNTAPLVQTLVGSPNGYQRTNVLEKFFILTRQNTTWTGVGYFVDTASTNYLNPLYRFSASADVSAQNMPWGLYTNFLANSYLQSPISPTNPTLSHLVDGVVHLTVRAYDINGSWITNSYGFRFYNGLLVTNYNDNVYTIQPLPLTLGSEVSLYMFSNTLPAAVQVEMGVLEDRTIQHAESLAGSPVAQANYLAQQAGKVHLFRQRFPIRNVDPSAYQ